MCIRDRGYLVRDEKPSFYIYRQIMWGRVQTGIVGCASVDEYASGVIKKHEPVSYTHLDVYKRQVGAQQELDEGIFRRTNGLFHLCLLYTSRCV